MSEPVDIPHCPMCGHDPYTRAVGPYLYVIGCACGFADSEEGMYPSGWRARVLSELSRQALELRTHGRGLSERHVEFVGYRANLIPLSLQTAWSQVLYDYEWIGQNPPGLR